MKSLARKFADSWHSFETKSVAKIASVLDQSKPDDVLPSEVGTVNPEPVGVPEVAKDGKRIVIRRNAATGKGKPQRARTRTPLPTSTAPAGHGFLKTVTITVSVLFVIAVAVALSGGVGGDSSDKDSGDQMMKTRRAAHAYPIRHRVSDSRNATVPRKKTAEDRWEPGTPEALEELNGLTMAEYMRKYGLDKNEYLQARRERLDKYRKLYGKERAELRREVAREREAAEKRKAMIARLKKARETSAAEQVGEQVQEPDPGTEQAKDSRQQPQVNESWGTEVETAVPQVQTEQGQLKWFDR